MDPERLFDTNFLIERAQSGDERALQRLYERYIRRVEGWTRGRVPNAARSLHDTESVAHEVLVKAILKTTSEDHRLLKSFQGYVRRAIRNRLIDLGSARKLEVEALEGDLPSDEPSELERLLEREFESDILRHIEQLPHESRQFLYLRFERELSYAQISELLGLASEDASRMRVNRILGRLREQLDGAA